MLRAGVRAVRLLPHDHRYRFRTWNIGPLLEHLAANRVPIWVDFGMRGWTDELIDWEGLIEVCITFPALPVVLVRASIGSNRRLFPAMERCPNLLVETSYYTVHRGIELVVSTFGAERLLFGTGFPLRAPGPAITALAYSLVSDDDRARIAGGNLRALLGAVRR
jgi:predicted TIM-barrel fold metal-dependent hydrolase